MNNSFFLHKEDVWSKAPTRMSSASRDIFEHFYKAIKRTFKHQFKDHQDTVGKIQNLRDWSCNCSSIVYESAKSRNVNITLPEYVERIAELPRETVFNGEEVLEVKEEDYDPKVYSDFEDFFMNADHGYYKTEKGRKVCLDLYRCFIQGVSKEKLQIQLKEEINSEKKWIENLISALNEYVKSESKLSWHQFLMNFPDENDF